MRPNVQLSAAPLAGFWKVEDAGRRQLPGNARAADPWSVRSIGVARAPGGCALSSRQQAEAFCRVNRTQPQDAPAASAAPRGSGAGFV